MSLICSRARNAEAKAWNVSEKGSSASFVASLRGIYSAHTSGVKSVGIGQMLMTNRGKQLDHGIIGR